MFAELLAHSCFSFLRGASQPEAMIVAARKLGLSGIVLCDYEGIYGAVRGLRETEAKPESALRYGIGAEFSLRLHWPDPTKSERFEDERSSIALLVQNLRGYENLCRLLTANHVEKKRSSLELGLLDAHSEGLFALWIAPRIPAVDASSVKWDELLGKTLSRCFGERCAIATYRHRDGFDAVRSRWAVARSAERGFPIVASARPDYADSGKRALADVLSCIRRGVTLEESVGTLDANGEKRLRSEAEMLELFSDHPEWVAESGRIAETLEFSLRELRYHFPCELEAGESADERLARLVEEGAKRRYGESVPRAVTRQLEKELSLIRQIQVAPYFLSTRDLVEIARERSILCQGRGSAANSAVCFVLGITAVDPARSNLLFDRFLSAERAEPPDIDIDFEHERREEVIQALYARYGRERAAMVSEVICYRGRSALREVAKVFELSTDMQNRLVQSLGHYWDENLEDQRLLEFGLDSRDARLRQIVAIATEMRGLPRHLSIHVGGFVLSSRPLYEVAPIEAATMAERTVIPWDKDDIDTLGFFKVDVLGLGMLTAIRKALLSVVASGGLSNKATDSSGALVEVNDADPLEVITRIPENDPETYERIGRADTVGVFQIESRAQMAMLPKLKPRGFYDLVVEVALVRPGPIQGGMVHPYLRRRGGEEPTKSPHPKLEKILARTLGVPLFQEQVMQIAIDGAGYSGGEADQLRRDMAAWKKHGRLLEHRDRLLEGFRKTGIADEFGSALFEQIKGFGEYGFPESHAASFALLVYVSAWLKTHYPAHFVCALLNSQPMGFYPPTMLIRDAQKHGVEVRDVGILESSWDCTLEETSETKTKSRAPGARKTLRLGARLVRGLSEDGFRRFERRRQEMRTRGEDFGSVEELVARSGLRKDEIARLAEAGALAALSSNRRAALFSSEAPRTGGLFARTVPHAATASLVPESKAEQLVMDYGTKSLSVEDHPLRYYRKRLTKLGVVRAEDLLYLPKGTRVNVAGMVMNRQRPATASGVVFMSLEDETGLVNLIVYSDVFEEFFAVATNSPLLLVRGTVERDERLAVPPRHVPEEDAPKATIHVRAFSLERLSRESFGISRDEKRSPRSSGESLRKLSRNFH